jgi:competence ComEA-like helix-hairpin-helix protein
MTGKIDLNQAGIEELSMLPGIGNKLAQRIVTYREEVHPFEEVIELVAVPGVSERMVRQIEDQLIVTAVANETTIEAIVEDEQVTEAEIIDAFEGSESEPETEEPVEIVAGEAVVETAETPEPEPSSADLPESVETATLKEEIEMAEPRQEPETAVTPPAAPAPVPPPPRNRSLVGAIIGAVFGAILGSVLTLTILNSLNGTLYFASQDRAETMEEELNLNIESVRGDQSNLSGDLETLGGHVATVEAEQARMALMEADVADLQDTAVSLEEQLVVAEERLDIVAESAENFDSFLNGLRDLLFDFQGAPVAPTPTETITPSPTTVPTETMVVTATAVPTETQTPPPATRTPRPTATPLVTATPAE